MDLKAAGKDSLAKGGGLSRAPGGVAAATGRAGDQAQALIDQAFRYYQERLKQTPEALASSHGEGSIADRTLGLRVPEKTRKAGHEISSRVQKLGLLETRHPMLPLIGGE